MKNILLAVILAAGIATSARASEDGDQWIRIGNNLDNNSTFELNQASIEIISPTIKRAIVRFKRTNPGERRFLGLPSYLLNQVEYIEMINDFDCKTPRIKTLQEVKVHFDGSRVKDSSEEIPMFTATSPGALAEWARKKVCSIKTL